MAVVIQFSPDDAKMFQAFAKQQAKLKELERGYGKVAGKAQKAGKKAEGAFGGKSLSSLAAYAGGLLTVGAAVGAVTSKYQTMIQNVKEFANEARKAGNELVAFAALQEGGTKAHRVRQVEALAVRYGITDRGEAFNIVQGLQSALGGDFKAGLSATETVFKAHQVGIPLADAFETEAVGLAQKQQPGVSIRRAFVAGEASTRSPEVVAAAGQGLAFFKDKDLGFAVAGVLAAQFADQLKTFVAAAGRGLGEVGNPEFQKTFKRLGVEKGTRLEKLEALRAEGLDTIEEIAKAGLVEKRQQQAVSNLVENLPQLKKMLATVRTEAVPGVLVKKRRGIEEEIPQARLAREVGVLEQAQLSEQAFGPRALASQGADRLALVRGLTLRRHGLEEGLFGRDFIDESGRTFPFAFIRALLRVGSPLGLPPQFERTMKEIAIEFGLSNFVPETTPLGEPAPSFRRRFGREVREGIEEREAAAALLRAAEKLERATENMGGGTTLAKPDEDR